MGTLILVLLCTGCQQFRYHDPDLHLSEQAFKEQFTPETEKTMRTPKKSDALTDTSPFMQPLSIHLSSAIPLNQALSALAENTGVNIALPETGLSEGVTYTAHNQAFMDIIKTICRLKKLRYELNHGTLFIDRDVPYLKTYDIQFLKGSRKTENTMSVSTDLEHQNSKMNAGNSKTTISSVSSLDFWGELEKSIQMMLNFSHQQHHFDQTTSEKKYSKSEKKPHFAIHQQAGLLSVYGNQTQHNLIHQYLERLKNLVNSQVLIEAKIVEVLLKDEFNTGINWDYFSQKLDFSGRFRPQKAAAGAAGHSILNIKSNKMHTALSLMETFGTVRTIANPRLTVLNNQSSALKVAHNEVFFTLMTEHVFEGNNRPHFEMVSSQIKTVPVGLVMTVQPSINPETEEVTLFIRPAISRVVETRNDPAVDLKSNGRVQSQIPVVQVREMDSMVKVKPGQVVIMGGLIEKTTDNQSKGLPGLRKTLGNALGQTSHKSDLSELVIFITVHLSQGGLKKRDSFLYEKL